MKGLLASDAIWSSVFAAHVDGSRNSRKDNLPAIIDRTLIFFFMQSSQI